MLNNKEPNIEVTLDNLIYQQADHKLVLPVEWSFIDSKEFFPQDFEVKIKENLLWTEPTAAPISSIEKEKILDQIALRFSKGPKADIVGENGEFLRGVSPFKFYLQPYPHLSRYYELDRFLSIPMLPSDPIEKNGKRWTYLLDFSEITKWTTPDLPLKQEKIQQIIDRISALKPSPFLKIKI